MGPDPQAAVFGALADEYAAARPGYPEALFDALWERLSGVVERPVVLDVAAGAGAATRVLAVRPARVVALDPSVPMLIHARRAAAGAAGWRGAVAACAEALPVVSASADAVTVAQAFHWFDPDPALEELARVLRSGGVLALLWNIQEADPFMDAVWELVEESCPGHKRPVSRGMRRPPEALRVHPEFTLEPPLEFEQVRRLTADEYVRFAFSWSYVGGALEGAERSAFERRLRALYGSHHGAGPRTDAFVSVVHFARRR